MPRQPQVRLVLVVLALVLLGSAIRNIKEPGDFRGYLEVGNLVLSGADIYAEARPGTNTWPPFFALLCVPLALLARPSVFLARGAWLLLNGVLLFATLRLLIALVYRRPLVLDPRPGTISLASAAVLVPLLLTSRFVLGNLDRLQINVVILFCCVAGYSLLARGRPAAGGALIGFAAAMKVLPVFFLPYFAWKRWWGALGAALVVGAACSLSPILVFGPARFRDYVERWLAIAGSGWPVRKGNQSMYAAVDRFVNHWDTLWTPGAQYMTASSDPAVTAIVYGCLAAIALVFVVVARRGGPPASLAAAIELAIVLAVAVLFSPLAWKHYFVFLLPAYMMLWAAASGGAADGARPGSDGARRDGALDLLLGHERRGLRAVLVLSFALTTLTVRGLVGKPASVVFELLSNTTWGALLVLAALLWLRALAGERTSER